MPVAETLVRLDPLRIGLEVAARERRCKDLVVVEVHLGVSDLESIDHRDLVRAWSADRRVVPCVRQNRRGHEVGVDVACALSCAHAVLTDDRCDAAALFSGDLDLRPATEEIARWGPPDSVTTVSWATSSNKRARMPKDRIVQKGCRNLELGRDTFEACLHPTPIA